MSCVFLEVVNNKFFFYKLVSSFILWCDDKLLLSKLLYLHGIYYNVIRQDPNHDIYFNITNILTKKWPKVFLTIQFNDITSCLLLYMFSHVNLKFLSFIVSTMGVALACTKGESTLRGPKIVVTLFFFQGSHVWSSTMSLLWRIFTIFMHIMVGQNPKKSNGRNITIFYFMWCDVKVYLCQKTCHTMY